MIFVSFNGNLASTYLMETVLKQNNRARICPVIVNPWGGAMSNLALNIQRSKEIINVLRDKFPKAVIVDLQLVMGQPLPSHKPRSCFYHGVLTHYWDRETELLSNVVTNHFSYQINEFMAMLSAAKKYVVDSPYCLFPWTYDTTREGKMSAIMHSKNDLFSLVESFPLLARLYGVRVETSAGLPIAHLTKEDIIGLIDDDLLRLALPLIECREEDYEFSCNSTMEKDSLEEEYPEIPLNELDLFKTRLSADRSSMTLLEKIIFKDLSAEDIDFTNFEFENFRKEYPGYFEISFDYVVDKYNSEWSRAVISLNKDNEDLERDFKERLARVIVNNFGTIAYALREGAFDSMDYYIGITNVTGDKAIPSISQSKELMGKLKAYNSKYDSLEAHFKAAKEVADFLNMMIAGTNEGSSIELNIVKPRKPQPTKEVDVEVVAVNEEAMPDKVFLMAGPNAGELKEKEDN